VTAWFPDSDNLACIPIYQLKCADDSLGIRS
jgi:hypothetical protein